MSVGNADWILSTGNNRRFIRIVVRLCCSHGESDNEGFFVSIHVFFGKDAKSTEESKRVDRVMLPWFSSNSISIVVSVGYKHGENGYRDKEDGKANQSKREIVRIFKGIKKVHFTWKTLIIKT